MLDLEHLDALDDDAPPEPDLGQVQRRVRRLRTRKRWTAVAAGVVVLAGAVAVVVAVGRSDHAVRVEGPSDTTAEGTLPNGLPIVLTLDTPTVRLGDDIRATVVVRNDTDRIKTLGPDPIQCALQIGPVLSDAAGTVVAEHLDGPCYSIGVNLFPGESRSISLDLATTNVPLYAGEARYSLELEDSGEISPFQGRPVLSVPVRILASEGVTARLELPKTSYPAGYSLEGTIVFVNGTGRPVDYYVGCDRMPPWEVVLAKNGVLFEVPQALRGCIGPPTKAVLAPGVTRVPFGVGLRYRDCSSLGAIGIASPRCVGPPPGITDLAPGSYQIVFRGEGAPFQSLKVEPLDITVTARAAAAS